MTDKNKAILEHIDKIEQFARKPENGWLLAELERRFGGNSRIYIDIKEIREALQIRGQNSITYGFIKNHILRNQLLVDNLRMENYALNLQSSNEPERFYYFCVNAFYQIENILNYYFYTRFPNLESLLTHMETASASIPYPFKRSGTEKNVGDIAIQKKISVFCAECFPFSKDSNDFTFNQLNQLRMIRNEGFHRCDVIKKDKNEELLGFFKKQDFNTVRALLKKVVAKIEQELNEPQQFEATITQVLPSAICVKYNYSETACFTIKKQIYKENDKILIERNPNGTVKIVEDKG